MLDKRSQKKNYLIYGVIGAMICCILIVIVSLNHELISSNNEKEVENGDDSIPPIVSAQEVDNDDNFSERIKNLSFSDKIKAVLERERVNKEQKNNLVKAKSLYDELIEFKDDEAFHIRGFIKSEPMTKYALWKDKVDALSQKSGQEFTSRYQISMNDILGVGIGYMLYKGEEPEYNKSKNQKLKEAFKKLTE